MRPSGLLLRVPATLRRGVLRVAAASVALALLVPVPVAAVSRPTAGGSGGPPGPAAGLPPPPGKTTLVSERFGGGFAGGASAEASISGSGRYVAFTSGAADLVAGDVNGGLDVFVRDRNKGKTIRLPLPNGAPVPKGGRASDPSISSDGSVVAFTYQLTSGTAVTGSIVMAWDRSTGTTAIVSRNVRGATAPGSREPSVSDDGRYVAYTSDNNLIVTPDGNGTSDVFRYDRRTRTTVRVSTGFGGGAAGGASPSISGDGGLVAFVSAGGDTVVPENTGPGNQVYVRDVGAGTTERISAAVDGGPADTEATAPSISSDGRWVAFESPASNLVPGDGNRYPDVFRRDRQADVTELVSVTPDGAPAEGPSGQASISRDGRMVGFTSAAIDLVAAGPFSARLAAVVQGRTEVYLRDVDAKDTILVSVDRNGAPGGGRSLGPSVGGNGRYVAFASTSATLVKGDDNKQLDVFIRDFPPSPRLNPAVVDFGTRAVGSDPTPGAAILANAGWSPLAVTGATVTGGARADFGVSIDGCRGVVLHRGEACTVTVTFKPTREGTRTATLEVADAYSGSPRTARLRGSGSQARIELDPAVGEPGTVVIATGTGFPPGAQVRLSWSLGITPKLPVVRADAKGRFRVQVLVFHNDRTGSRDLDAQAVGSTLFPPVSAPMLVSTPSAMPAGFGALYRFVDLPLMLIIRG